MRHSECIRHKWAQLTGRVSKKEVPTALYTCLVCGQLKVGTRTIRISQYRLDMGGNPIKNTGAPTATGDALIKGTRLTLAELPAGSTSGQVLTAQGAGVDPVWAAANSTFFGDGSDGTFVSANTTYAVGSADGGPVVKQYTGDFTLNNGHTITVDNRCRGLVLFVQGNVTINGNIDLTGKAAYRSLTDDPLLFPVDVTDGLYHPGKGWSASKTSQIVAGLLGGRGGRGGRGGSVKVSIVGSVSVPGSGGSPNWWGGGVGGGGGGGDSYYYASTYRTGGGGGAAPTPGTALGSGGASVSKSSATSTGGSNGNDGGNGAGGSGAATTPQSTETFTATSGAGGSAPGGGGGGGIMQYTVPSSSAGSGLQGGYGGGLLVIIASGNITIGATGQIKCNGGNGGNGGNGLAVDSGTSSAAAGGGGGGGAGGGVVLLLHGGSYTNSGSIQVNGGSGGTAGSSASSTTAYMAPENGESGQVGTIKVVQIAA